MSKKDLIDAVAKEAELTKDKATVAVDAVLEHIRSAMKNGNEVRIPDFGTFKVAAAQGARGPQPGHGRDHQHSRLAGAEVQPLQGPEGHPELSVLREFPGRLRRVALCCGAPFLFSLTHASPIAVPSGALRGGGTRVHAAHGFAMTRGPSCGPGVPPLGKLGFGRLAQW